jgi:hypothetical protein
MCLFYKISGTEFRFAKKQAERSSALQKKQTEWSSDLQKNKRNGVPLYKG